MFISPMTLPGGLSTYVIILLQLQQLTQHVAAPHSNGRRSRITSCRTEHVRTRLHHLRAVLDENLLWRKQYRNSYAIVAVCDVHHKLSGWPTPEAPRTCALWTHTFYIYTEIARAAFSVAIHFMLRFHPSGFTLKKRAGRQSQQRKSMHTKYVIGTSKGLFTTFFKITRSNEHYYYTLRSKLLCKWVFSKPFQEDDFESTGYSLIIYFI